MPLVGRRPAQPSQPRRFLVLHPLEHVRDHQNPLAHTPAFPSCQAPQLRRPRVAAKKVYRHCPIAQTWYARLNTLPHLGITGSRYYMPSNHGLWVKTKCLNQEEFVVVGRIDPEGSRPFLVLAYYTLDGRLV